MTEQSFCETDLGMELHTMNVLRSMRETHNDVLAILHPSGDLEARRKIFTVESAWASAPAQRARLTCRLDDQAIVGDHLHLLRQPFEQAFASVRDRATLSVLDLLDVPDPASERRRDALMTEADTEDGNLHLSKQLIAEAKVFRSVGSARAGREDDAVDVGEHIGLEIGPGEQ